MNRVVLYLCLLFGLLLSPVVMAADIDTGDAELDRIFNVLYSGSFDDKAQALRDFMQTPVENKKAFLNGIVDKSLMVHKKTGRVVWVEEQDNKYQMTDAFNGEDLGLEKTRKLKKFSVNNQLRSQITALISVIDLDSPDAAIRLAAVNEMLSNPAPEHSELLQQRLATEPDKDVQQAMQLGISLANLGHADSAVRLEAIAAVSESLEPAVRNALSRIVTGDEDVKVRAAAEKVVERQQQRIKQFGYIETLFFGLSLGSVLVLAAIGLAITFGVMGVINMAHGELIMLGAYTTYLLQQAMPDSAGLALLISIPAAFIVSGLVGIGIERSVIRFLYGRPLETLLATFGISLVLQQLVRTAISPQNVPVSNPDWMSGFIQVNSVLSLTYNRLYILGFCLVVFVLLSFVLKKTRLGLEVRAVSQNRSMARAMGIHSSRVDALTFGLGSGIAGVAGVALSQLTNVGPNLGQAYIVDSFMVVVFGGVGNLWGTLIGGMTLGVVNKFMEPWTGAVLAKILVLVFIILFIQKRPRGLFPQKGRAAEG
ncbi:MAG: urea ABC transporter permease subunit UrtB [Chromatiales bacterium]|jgi:urea transport system permease protein